METKKVKLVVFVPLTHADLVRQALGEIGAGKIGNYEYCSFSTRGMGRFRGNDNSNPSIGTKGIYESVEEEKIEVIILRENLEKTINAVKVVHPYEEVALDIYPLEDYL